MNQAYRIGDQVVLAKQGTIVRADWNYLKEETEYMVLLEGKTGPNHITVPENLIMGVNEQRLTPEEIKALNKGGIPA